MPITKLKFEYDGMRHESSGAHPKGFWIESYNEDTTITFNYFSQKEGDEYLRLMCDIYILHEGGSLYDWEDYDLTPEGYVTDESRHFSYKIPANSRIYVSSNLPLQKPDPEGIWDNYLEPFNINADKPFKVGGNIMSLYSRDNFNSITSTVAGVGLWFLFSGSLVKDASNLILPATTLTVNCYWGMFSSCTSLISAPVLPATTLANGCYRGMFERCTSLTSAPELPAITLAPNCYNEMFFGCSSLNYIKALFTTTPDRGYTENWVYGVANTGTFVKSHEAEWDLIGVDGVPTGWTIEDDRQHFREIPLTLTTLEDNTMFKFSNAIEYSIDEGETWTTLAANTNTPSFNANTEVMFKSLYVTGSVGAGTFSSNDKTFNASGNVMSLLYGDNFINQTSLEGKDYAFINLFRNSKVVDIFNLILPATTLSLSCYQQMFSGCTSLTTATELPATTLANSCYISMFAGCTSLTSAPTLPATTLANGCYFGMFGGCTSLTTASVLPATTLANSCYSSMFIGCISLTVAPELPATTLTSQCYANMFNGCTSLTTAPVLPAPQLIANCYAAMFKNCSSLNYIKAKFISTPSDSYTRSWVEGVASTGTFVKSSGAVWDVTGINGVPTGWEIEYEGKDWTYEPLTLTTLENGTTFTCDKQITYSSDYGFTWTTLAANTDTPAFNANTEILFKSTLTSVISGVGNIRSNDKTFNASGNVMSLIYGDNFRNQTSLEGKDYAFIYLFARSKLVDASNLALPATTLYNNCYDGMFSGCTSLTSAPVLPATTLAPYCYNSMFSGCTSLTTAPVLPATTLVDHCYTYLFHNCSSLNYIKALFTTTPGVNYTYDWVRSVAEHGTFVKSSDATWNSSI